MPDINDAPEGDDSHYGPGLNPQHHFPVNSAPVDTVALKTRIVKNENDAPGEMHKASNPIQGSIAVVKKFNTAKAQQDTLTSARQGKIPAKP